MELACPLTSALWTSLGALVPVLPPPRVVPALQRALRDLLAEEPPPATASGTTPQPSKRSRTRGAGNIEAWTALRTRLLAVLAERGLTRRQLADQVAIRHKTLRSSLWPSGRPPGRANLEKLQQWLDARQATEATRTTAGNGSDHRTRLTDSERERLAGYAELDERAVRKTIGVTHDVVSAAVAGESLAPELISRLVGFLEQPAPRGDVFVIDRQLDFGRGTPDEHSDLRKAFSAARGGPKRAARGAYRRFRTALSAVPDRWAGARPWVGLWDGVPYTAESGSPSRPAVDFHGEHFVSSRRRPPGPPICATRCSSGSAEPHKRRCFCGDTEIFELQISGA